MRTPCSLKYVLPSSRNSSHLREPSSTQLPLLSRVASTIASVRGSPLRVCFPKLRQSYITSAGNCSGWWRPILSCVRSWYPADTSSLSVADMRSNPIGWAIGTHIAVLICAGYMLFCGYDPTIASALWISGWEASTFWDSAVGKAICTGTVLWLHASRAFDICSITNKTWFDCVESSSVLGLLLAFAGIRYIGHM